MTTAEVAPAPPADPPGGAGARGRRPSARARRRPQARQRARAFYVFVGPWLTGFVLLTVTPMLFALWMSFTDYDGISPHWNYQGFGNYRTALSDERTWQSLGRTGLFTVLGVGGMIVTGLLLAVLVDQKVRGRALFRAIFYLPAVVPPVAAALTFRLLFDRDAGAVNAVGDLFGATPQAWLTGNRIFVVIVLFVLWGSGTNMVISLAALQEVPRDLIEAAQVDGAGPARIFRSLTLPLISPALFFQVVTGVIFSVQTFIPALLLSSAGSAQPTAVPDSLYLFMVHVYTQAFGLGQLGYASALLWLLFAALIAVTVVIFRVSGRAVFYATGPNRSEEAG